MMKVTKPPKIEEILFENVLKKVAGPFLPNMEQQPYQLENTAVGSVRPETEESLPSQTVQIQNLNIPIPEKQKLADVEKLFEECYRLMTTHKATDEKGRYLYWDKIKHKYGKHAEMVWAATKINRLAGKKKITDFQNHEFSFCVPDTMQSLLHFIDKTCGSHMMLSDGLKLPEADKKTLMMEESITSAQLEGAVTTRKVAKALLHSKRQKPKDKHEKMIVNNYRLMQKVVELKNEPLSIDLILSLHRIATEEAIENQAVSGAFRQTDDIHIADYDRNLVYQPPKCSEVPQLMETLCRFANTDHDGIENPLFIHPVVKAVMLHFLTGYIHPFGDGNGRTARALFYWFMLKNGYGLFEYISISRLLNQAPSKYAKSYLYTEYDDLDMTYFIYYQLDVIKRAILDLQAYVERESAKLKNFTAEIAQFAERHQLNSRQIEILQTAVQDKGRTFKVKDTAAQFDVAENTARADLNRLAALKLLGRLKDGNAIHFVALGDLKERLR
jgi:fic family protein